MIVCRINMYVLWSFDGGLGFFVCFDYIFFLVFPFATKVRKTHKKFNGQNVKCLNLLNVSVDFLETKSTFTALYPGGYSYEHVF